MITAWITALLAGPLNGAVSLSPGISSNMVLQRDVTTRITGWADAGEEILVMLGDQVVGKARGSGPKSSWSVELPKFKAGPVPDITIKATNSITLSNLLAGDVWICSGQSNMEMVMERGALGGVLNWEEEVAAATNPHLRLFNARDTKGWLQCAPDTAKSFSATAYFFGRELTKELGDVPIGLVMVAVGGTAAEYWLPRATRETWSGFPAALEEARRNFQEFEPLDTEFRKSLATWKEASIQAGKNGTQAPTKPVPKLNGVQQEQLSTARVVINSGSYYSSRIEPLTAHPIKGAIWYQGESNVIRHSEYAELMTQLIGSWRKGWGQGDFPFLIMQLVNLDVGPQAGVHQWAELRAAQQQVADTVPNTGIAIGIDIGDPKNIHPSNKQEVGRRLGLLALNQVYGHNRVAEGPKPAKVEYPQGRVVVTFHQPWTLKSNTPNDFELAGKDGIFKPAVAEKDGLRLILTSPEVPVPCAVRYAWQNNPPASVFNTEGLPAAPFRQIQ
jgi:sialate O-acetylesterase